MFLRGIEGPGKRPHRRKYRVLRCLDCIVVKRMILSGPTVETSFHEAGRALVVRVATPF